MTAPRLPAERGTPPANAIVFDNVSIAFQENQVLDGISFHLAQGETKALFGVAGSGKSLILKLALGLIKPDAVSRGTPNDSICSIARGSAASELAVANAMVTGSGWSSLNSANVISSV